MALTDDVALKIRLERTLRRELGGPFARLGRQFRAIYAVRQSSPSVDGFRTAIEASLYAHYERAQRAFAGRVLAESGTKSFLLTKRTADEQRAIEQTIALALAELREKLPPEQAARLAQTASADMEFAVIQARQMLLSEVDDLGSATVAAAAAAILMRRFNSRIDTIVTTETQSAVESARQIEAEAVAGITPFILAFAPLALPARSEAATKTWRTLGDDRVRPAHQFADRQSVGVDQRFSVGGEPLRFPGDVLNGSVGNVINCRCSAEYRIA